MFIRSSHGPISPDPWRNKARREQVEAKPGIQRFALDSGPSALVSRFSSCSSCQKKSSPSADSQPFVPSVASCEISDPFLTTDSPDQSGFPVRQFRRLTLHRFSIRAIRGKTLVRSRPMPRRARPCPLRKNPAFNPVHPVKNRSSPPSVLNPSFAPFPPVKSPILFDHGFR